MPRNTPLFRVFISSTFSDFVAEREVLRDHVFPRLRTLCRARGAAFQAVDLRWGISRAAAESHDTMRICLDEIDRCRAVTKNPNFLALIGDRYGWRPPPQTIAADDFDAIRAHLRAGREDGHAHVDLLDRCYLRDDNAVPPHYRLDLDGTAAPKQSAVLDDVATVLRSVALALPWSEHRRRSFIASATEQEIARRGLLDGDGTDGSALCIFRSIAGLPADARAQSYRDLRTDGTLDTEAQKRLRALKRQLRANVGQVRTHVPGAMAGKSDFQIAPRMLGERRICPSGTRDRGPTR
jgi:Domain of unknown function (DUF4062)